MSMAGIVRNSPTWYAETSARFELVQPLAMPTVALAQAQFGRAQLSSQEPEPFEVGTQGHLSQPSQQLCPARIMSTTWPTMTGDAASPKRWEARSERPCQARPSF